MLFDKESDQRGSHYADADESEYARAAEDAEEKENTANKHEQHSNASGEF